MKKLMFALVCALAASTASADWPRMICDNMDIVCFVVPTPEPQNPKGKFDEEDEDLDSIIGTNGIIGTNDGIIGGGK